MPGSARAAGIGYRVHMAHAGLALTLSDTRHVEIHCDPANNPGEDIGGFAGELALMLRTRLEELGDLGHDRAPQIHMVTNAHTEAAGLPVGVARPGSTS